MPIGSLVGKAFKIGLRLRDEKKKKREKRKKDLEDKAERVAGNLKKRKNYLKRMDE